MTPIFDPKCLETMDQINRSMDFLRQHELSRMRAGQKIAETRKLLDGWIAEELEEDKKVKDYEIKLTDLKKLLMEQLDPPQASFEVADPLPTVSPEWQIGRTE